MEPMLAESWEASADKMTWTFNLRQGVQFHRDFGEFTTADVSETLVHEGRDESQSTRKALWNDQVIPNLEVTDDHTVTFHLAEPTINFDWILSSRNTTYIFSKDHLDAEGDDAAVATSPVGTGPYQIRGERESGGLCPPRTNALRSLEGDAGLRPRCKFSTSKSRPSGWPSSYPVRST